MTDPTPRAFTLEVELLEDLHTGSGMGSAVVDRLIARAPDGTPIIAAEHIKGVWRDNALRLAELDHMDQDQIERLFGSANGLRGCLQTPELRPKSGLSVKPLYWDATARSTGDRAPDDHSLRRTEYLPAGLALVGQGLLSPGDAELEAALERIVRFTNTLGSERTRGSGLIRAKLDWLEASSSVLPSAFGPSPQPQPDLGAGVRLLLRADAPLCIPITGAPGNIVLSEHHIPGRTLFGALARSCIAKGTKPAVLFERKLAIGPAYPLPAGAACEDAASLADLQVIPMPLNLWSPKPGAGAQSSWPYWLPQSRKQQATQDKVSNYRNMLRPLKEQEHEESWRPNKTRYKRPRDNAYLYRQGDAPWRAFDSRLGLRMRNRRGDPLRHNVAETEAALFTVEQIPSGTRFVADIRPLDPGDAEAVGALMELLDLGENSVPTLRVGRGGARVSVLGWCPLGVRDEKDEGEDDKTRDAPVTVTLLTDLISRAPDLRFHSQLTPGALRDAMASDTLDIATGADRVRTFSDNYPYRSFNAVSGLPAAPRIAIRRGSVLSIDGPSARARARSRACQVPDHRRASLGRQRPLCTEPQARRRCRRAS